MSEGVRAYLETLKGLSNDELDRSAQELARREKNETAHLIATIAELGDRTVPVDLAYGSLFDYCVNRLNLSEGSVYRRTQVAGMCRRFPEILDSLARGRLHLTGASLIAPHLTQDTAESLIAAAEGKTKRQIKEILAALAPREPFTSSVRKRPSRAASPGEATSELLVPVGGSPESKAAPPRAVDTSAALPSGEQRPRDLLEPATVDQYNFRFCATSAFTESFTRLAEVLGIERPHTCIQEVLREAIEFTLEHKDPIRKAERREKRKARQETHERENEAPAPCPGEEKEELEHTLAKALQESAVETPTTPQTQTPAATRHVPADVRERVFERAGHQCEFRGPDGTRCRSRTGLQIEHTRPFAVYRTHEERFLRAFCPAHNRFAAEQYYGRGFIERKLDAARREESAACESG